jgi:aspartyl-tRNA(Asn)/glutamyl-tRNA(Gln) amidotransferase subunit C
LSRRTKTQKPLSVDLRQVDRLADLSRLTLSQREAERLRIELSSILQYFAALDKVKIGDLPTSQGAGLEAGLRGDVVRPSTPDDILQGVPQRKGRHVRAPRVF